MSVARVFRLGGRWNLEWRLIATNVLNRVTFATIDTVVDEPAVRFPDARQSDADAADGCEASLLTCAA